MFKNGTYVDGPFYFDEDPLDSALLHSTCNPDFCYCKDSPDVERDSRNVEMRAIMEAEDPDLVMTPLHAHRGPEVPPR